MSKTTSNTFNEFKQSTKAFLGGPVMNAFGRMGTQRHLLAIRNGIIATIPFVIIGATAFMLLNFPIGSGTGVDSYLKSVMPAHLNNLLLFIFRFGMGTMGLFSAWGIGSELGKSYRFSPTTSGLLGVFAYLLLFIPTNGSSMTLGKFDGSSILPAIIGAVGAVEIAHFCARFKITVKMPDSVPEAVSSSFAALFPVLFISVIYGGTRVLLGFDVSGFIVDVFKPMENYLSGGIAGALTIIFLVTLFWWVGIHGTSMIGAVIRPFWQSAVSQNGDYLVNNPGDIGNIPFPFSEQYLQWFVWIGGAGATLGLIISGLIFARSKQMKTIVRISALPALFNINEPIMFGMPIIFNPFLGIPFILAPITMALVSWPLMEWMNTGVAIQVAWTLPAPIGAYFSSGGQWEAIVISCIDIAIAVGIWAPFTIMYDKRLRAQEAQGQEGAVKVLSDEEIKANVAKTKGLKSTPEVKGAK